jgi:hypothetical protein
LFKSKKYSTYFNYLII